VTITTPFDHFCGLAEQTCEEFTCKRVIQASTASSHRVGKCIIEPSKQSRIRKSSFWSRRRSTVRWETALSSKERSRRVNCPMLVPYNTFFTVLFRVKHASKIKRQNNYLQPHDLHIFFKFCKTYIFFHLVHMPVKKTSVVFTCFLHFSFAWKQTCKIYFTEAVTSCNGWVTKRQACCIALFGVGSCMCFVCSIGMRWV
jgi:hypothetical protein